MARVKPSKSVRKLMFPKKVNFKSVCFWLLNTVIFATLFFIYIIPLLFKSPWVIIAVSFFLWLSYKNQNRYYIYWALAISVFMLFSAKAFLVYDFVDKFLLTFIILISFSLILISKKSDKAVWVLIAITILFASIGLLATCSYLYQSAPIEAIIVSLLVFIFFGAYFFLITQSVFKKMGLKEVSVFSYKVIKNGLGDIFLSFRRLGWFEYLGVGIIVLSLLKLWSIFSEPLTIPIQLLLTFYTDYITYIPDEAIKLIFELFNWDFKNEYTYITITCFIFFRAANMRSKRLLKTNIWNSIKMEIAGQAVISYFPNQLRFWLPLALSWIIIHSILSIYGLNPTQNLAPDGTFSFWSITYAGVSGFLIGVVLKWLNENQHDFKFVYYLLIGIRAVFFFIPLTIIAPFVAWRVLVLSLLIFILVVWLDSYVPEIQLIAYNKMS